MNAIREVIKAHRATDCRVGRYGILRPLPNGEIKLCVYAARRFRDGCIKAQRFVEFRTDRTTFRHRNVQNCGMGGYVVRWRPEDMWRCQWQFGSLGLDDFNVWTTDPFHPRLGLNWPGLILNLDALVETKYRWCGWKVGCGVELINYLKVYRDYPQVEYLAKAGYWNLVSQEAAKWIRRNPKAILAFIKQNGDKAKCCRFRTLRYAFAHGVSVVRAETHFKILAQAKSLGIKGVQAEEMAAWIEKTGTDWHDYTHYLDKARRAGMDMESRGVLFPILGKGWRSLAARTDRFEAMITANSHNMTVKQYTALIKSRKAELEKFQRSLDRVKRLDFGGGLKCVIAKSQEELRKEGDAMGNCVGMGMYGTAMIVGKSVIVMIRRDGEPFVDVEIDRKNWRVVQCYGKHNSAPPDECRKLAELVAKKLKQFARAA